MVVRKSDMVTVEGNTKGRCRPKLALGTVVHKYLGFLIVTEPDALDINGENEFMWLTPIDWFGGDNSRNGGQALTLSRMYNLGYKCMYDTKMEGINLQEIESSKSL